LFLVRDAAAGEQRSSSSLSEPVDGAFHTLFLPRRPDGLSSVEIFISRDVANQFAANASGSVLFNLQGFIQAKNQVRAYSLHAWIEHATWTSLESWNKTPHTGL
jgi:hypothetical protein